MNAGPLRRKGHEWPLATADWLNPRIEPHSWGFGLRGPPFMAGRQAALHNTAIVISPVHGAFVLALARGTKRDVAQLLQRDQPARGVAHETESAFAHV